MKIVQVHNYYQQAGGEDVVVAAERALLEANGNVVVPFYKDNEALGAGLWALIRASLQTLWNRKTYREFRQLLRQEKPGVVHCHNTFPLISPSIYWACAKEKVPVVQTLHNYRLLCLNAFLFREAKQKGHEASGVRRQEKNRGECGNSDPKAQCPAPSASSAASGICELCLTKSFKWPGVKYGCYRDSKAGSLVVALMLFIHKLIGTWTKKVTAYIALTDFQKQKMIQGGLPAEKIWVKPNFLADAEGGQQEESGGTDVLIKPSAERLMPDASYCLFVGRLSPEKGCDVLLKAWAIFQGRLKAKSQKLEANNQPQLIIVGDGPERESLEPLANSKPLAATCSFMGKQPKAEVLSLMKGAQFLVLPSVWYEGFPMTIVEAFSKGLSVLASDTGGMSLIIDDGENGLKFDVADSASLADRLEWAFANPDQMREMGEAARLKFGVKYSAEVNYQQLIDICREAMGK